MRSLKSLVIKGNRLFLDKELIEGIIKYELASSTDTNNTAELTIKMLVKVDQVET